MEQEFNQATQMPKNLQDAIKAACAQNPQAKIDTVEAALATLTAVYVTPADRGAARGVVRSGEGASPTFIVGVCCGDGAEKFEINAGLSRENGEKIARAIIRHNPEMQVLTSKAPQPFIAVRPERITRVDDFQDTMIFQVQGGGHAFAVQHEDAHRANIDSFLLENKLMQMRAACVQAPQAKAGQAKTGRSSPRPDQGL